MNTNLSPAVKRKSNEMILSTEEHNNFSGDEQTSNLESTGGQETDWEAKPTPRVYTNDDINIKTEQNILLSDKQLVTLEQDINLEDIDKETIPLPPQKRTKNWKHSRKYQRKLKKKIETDEDDDEYYTDWLINLIMAICYAISQTTK